LLEQIRDWNLSSCIDFFSTSAFSQNKQRQVSRFRRGVYARAHKVHDTVTRERKCRVFFHGRETEGSVMKLKSRQTRDVLLRWRIYTPRRVSFKDLRAAFAYTHEPSTKCECEHGAYVLRNFELGFNEANDTAVRLLIRVRDNPKACCNYTRMEAL